MTNRFGYQLISKVGFVGILLSLNGLGQSISVQVKRTDGAPISTLAISPDSTVAASVDAMGTIRLWDITTQLPFCTLSTKPKGDIGSREEFPSVDRHGDPIPFRLSFSHNSEYLAISADDGTIEIASVASCESILRREPVTPQTSNTSAIGGAFSGDDSTIVIFQDNSLQELRIINAGVTRICKVSLENVGTVFTTDLIVSELPEAVITVEVNQSPEELSASLRQWNLDNCTSTVKTVIVGKRQFDTPERARLSFRSGRVLITLGTTVQAFAYPTWRQVW